MPSFDLSVSDQLSARSLGRVFGNSDRSALSILAEIFSLHRQGKVFKLPGQMNPDLLKEFVQNDSSLKPLVQIEDFYLFDQVYQEMMEIIQFLKQIPSPLSDQPDLSWLPSSLSEEQKTACALFLNSQWTLLLGGPGRGKTFTAKWMVEAFLKDHPFSQIVLTAPTGKAAENLAKALKSEIVPKTLHALLQVQPLKFFVDEKDQIEADLLIIDECSMVDLRLASLLIKKIDPKTKILWIGDYDQLSPVHGYSFLKFLMELIPHFPVLSLATLSISFRTDCANLIRLSSAILNYNQKEISECYDGETVSFFPLNQVSPDLKEKAYSLIQFKQQPLDFSFLYRKKWIASHNVGAFGVKALNQMVLNALADYPNREEILVPILFTRNQEDQGIYNGKMGFCLYFHPDQLIYMPNKEPILGHLVPDFELAFALSIHKSQGSEFEEVELVLQEISTLSRSLLYTAVSRAKKRLTIYGEKKELIIEAEEEENLFKDLIKKLKKRSNAF